MLNTLFQPLKIGPKLAKNRIIFGSHTTNYARHNLLSERHADYYAARAEGEAGIIVLEEHIVHPSDLPYANALLGYLPETAMAIASITERMRHHQSLVLVQLNHNGQQSASDHNQRELWAPSAVPDVASREVPKIMEQADIDAVISGFVQVTRYVKEGKADGVELQISDRSLLRQFLSPLTNQRGDRYGGSLENRLRFVQETIEAVDAALGSEGILGVRFCADELAPWAGITPEQGIEIARLLTATGRIDYMTVTMGSILSTHMFPFHASMHTPPAYAAHLAAAIKAAVHIPVFAAGRIMNVTQAERVLAEEQADGVEMIRALIADPQLPKLSRDGRADEVRPCIACNQSCQVRSVMNVPLSCAVQPDVLHSMPTSISSISTMPQSSRTGGTHASTVLIVGGGPAGMEAARTAAQRGRRVVLYEREETLGGAVRLAAKGPGRDELQLITDYLQRQIEQLGVEIHTDVAVTAEMVLAQRPESVLIATGARSGSGLLPIPGRELPHVTDIRSILRGKLVRGQRVVIIDETAAHGVLSVTELLVSTGHIVEVVTEDWYVGRDLVVTHDVVPWMQRVLAQGLVMTPHTTVTRIEPEHVIVTDRFIAGERAIPADVVVLGVYEQPIQELYYALKGQVTHLFRAGDCVAPRRIEQAIAEGRQIGEQC
ncbi:MAG: FAD-dependent oxidoreductase [Ktedonobacteraceae bacterium]